MERLTRVLYKLYTVLFALMIAVITVMSAFRSTYFNADDVNEIPLYRWDNPVIVIGFFILVLLFLRWFSKRYPSRWKHAGVVSAIIAGALSLGFLLVLKSEPYMDCSGLVEIAEEFDQGDFSELTSPASQGSYMHIYPFQIGYIAYLQVIYHIFGEGNYFAAQVINCIFAAVMVRNLYEISGELVSDEKQRGLVQNIVSVLLVCCLPLFIDVTFVYGDVPGWSLAVTALLCVFRWIHQPKRWGYLLGMAVLVAIGYLLKTNVLIFLIAMGIILLLESLRRKDVRPVLFAVLGLVLAIGFTNALKAGYCRAAGIDSFPTGTPASCWIAMSLQEDDIFEDGWYNGYNIGTMKANNYDTAAADAVAKAKIAERIDLFLHHPWYTVRFFFRKFVSAWNDPMFDSQVKMNWGSRHIEDLGNFAKWLIWGSGATILYWFLNLLHFVIFASSLYEVLRTIRRQDETSRKCAYCILPTLGGMLFHLLWETQARYMIGYYCVMFPVAAVGLTHLSQRSFSGLRRRGIRKEQHC